MKKTLIAATGASLVLLLGACNNNASTGDFQKQTQDFINKNDGDVEKAAQTALSDAKCDKPGSTSVGTLYSCTAVDANGGTWTFDVEITSKNGFTVQSANPAGGSAATTTVAADDAATTTAG